MYGNLHLYMEKEKNERGHTCKQDMCYILWAKKRHIQTSYVSHIVGERQTHIQTSDVSHIVGNGMGVCFKTVFLDSYVDCQASVADTGLCNGS